MDTQSLNTFGHGILCHSDSRSQKSLVSRNYKLLNVDLNVIYLELAIEADGGVRKLFSGKKGRTSVP